MSTTIDQRVVEMRFDNGQFESGVANTMSSINKLKQSLDFDQTAQTVGLKFNAMYSFADQWMRNMANTVEGYAKRIVSALTIDPVMTGFNEYETKINAIQTIMSNTASKGTTMNDVTRVIGELNTYADKTIYNFAEMTRNIGTFTAAGVGLEDSAAAIQGIANLAAASGSTSQQASTAMYQLSQALAAGTVKLMDWNSVVNAGMGGEKFQEALKATAREHGVAVDDIIKKQGSFRESLSEGWITADILNETLNKFTVKGATEYANKMKESGKYTQEQADALIKEAQAMEDAATKVKTFTQLWDTLKESAQSGWSQTWEIIVGDFEEAKDFLSKVSDTIGGIIGASADARNEILENWKVLGGRTELINGITNAFEAIRNIITPISEAFREIFPQVTAEQLLAVCQEFNKRMGELREKFESGSESADKIKRIFKGLFSVVQMGIRTLSAIVKGAVRLLAVFAPVGQALFNVAAGFGDWLTAANEATKTSDIFGKVISGMVTVVEFVAGTIAKVFGGVKNIFSSFVNAAKEMGVSIQSVFSSMGSAVENWSLFRILQKLWNGVVKIVSSIGKLFVTLASQIGGSLGHGGFEVILDMITTLIAGGLGIKLIELIRSFKDVFGGVSDVIENVAGIFGGLGDVLQGFQAKLKAAALLKIAGAIAILAVSIMLISSIDSDKLYDSIVALSMLMLSLVGTFALMNKAGGGIFKVGKAASAMRSIAIAVLILSVALKQLSGLSGEELITGLGGVAALMGIVIASVKILSSGNSKNVIKGATQMVIFAAAIKLLASVCKDLSSLGPKQLLTGLGGILGLATIVVATAKILAMGKNKDVIKGATQMVIFGAAMKILVSVVKDFAEMSWESIGKGLVGILGVSTIIVATAKILSAGKSKDIIKGATQMVIFGAALKIIASVVNDFGSMSWESIGKGLVAIAGSLAAIVLALNFMPKGMVGKAVGLIGIAAAILIIAKALGQMGGMTLLEIGKGLLALGGALVILAVGLHAMNGTVGGSAALIISALALAILAPVLLAFGSMSWTSIAKGLVMLAGAFAVIGIAGALLSPILPAILGLAGALALVGVGVLALGVGLVAAGAGLSAIAVGFVALIGAVGGSISILVELVSAVIVGICEGIAKGIIAICKIISEGGPAIGEAIKVIVLTLCDVLLECVPKIVATVLEIIINLLDALGTHVPKIVDSLVNFIIGIIDALARAVPRLMSALTNLMMTIFQGAIDALKSIDPDTLLKGVLSVGLMAGLMFLLAGVASIIPMAMVGVVGLGLVIAELALVFAAIGGLAQLPGLKWLIGEGGEIMGLVGNAIGKFVGGIVGGAMEGISSSFPQIGKDLSSFMKNVQPFIDGASSIKPETLDGVTRLAGIILALTAADIIDSLTSWFTGGSSLADFGKDLVPFGSAMAEFSAAVSGIDAQAVEAAANAGKMLAEMAAAMPNSGGVVSWFTGDNDMGDFGKQLTKFGEGIANYSAEVSGVNVAQLSAVTTEFSKLATVARGASGIDFGAFAQSLQDVSGNCIDSFVESFANAHNRVHNAVVDLLTTMVNAFVAKTAVVSNAALAVVTTAALSIKLAKPHFYSAGANLAAGLSAGIKDGKSGVINSAVNMATAAVNKIKEVLKINSPSKVLIDVGHGVPEGFSAGIDEFGGMVATSVSNMGDGAIEGVKDSVSKIADAINSDIDAEPTIRPVLDLSAVRSGASAIGGIFGSGETIGVSTNVGAISSAMARRGQNGGVNDVVSSIDKLRKDLNGMERNSYSIGGIYYEEGSDVAEALKVIIREAKIERRR